VQKAIEPFIKKDLPKKAKYGIGTQGFGGLTREFTKRGSSGWAESGSKDICNRRKTERYILKKVIATSPKKRRGGFTSSLAYEPF
jgi:hypothetical protein